MNKINGQKLLPQSKGLSVSKKKLNSSQLVPYKNIKQSYSGSVTPTKDKPKEQKETLLGNVINIKRTVIKIERLISTRNTSLLKDQKNKQKENENKKRSEREKDLETKKESKSLNIPTPNLPRIGIIDYIKNFLKWVIIGRAFMLFSKFIPNILSFLKNFKFLYDFFKILTGAVFNGLVTFIEWTDKAQKKLREIVGSLGGEPFQKAFDNFSGALTTFANLALIAGLATMGGSDLGVGDALGDVDPDGKKPRGKRPRVTTSGGRTAGRPNIRNPLRQRPQITTGGSGTGRPRVTTSKGRTARTPRPKPNAPKITGSGVNQGGKLAAKSLLKTVRPLLRGMVIGGLIDFGLSVALGENPGRAAFGAIGATLLGTIGGILGGPFAPFTAIGGGLLGDWAGRKLYDAFFTGKKPSNTKPQKKNQGGSIKPKTGQPVKSVRRAPKIQKARVPVKQPIKKTEPGKDLGGVGRMRMYYSDPTYVMTMDEFNRSPLGQGSYNYLMYKEDLKKPDVIARRNRRPNPFKALTKVSETLKSTPFLGRILGAPIDAALGQKPDKFAFRSFSEGISYLTNTLATNEINQSMSILRNNIRAFAEGGEVPRDLVSMRNRNDYEKIFENILGKDVESSFNKSLDAIRKEVDKRSKPSASEPPPGGDIDPSLGNVTVTSDSPDFWLLVTAALFENGKPTDGYQGAADVAQAIYNRVSLPGWPKSIRDVILEKGQFQPVRQYGGYDEWGKIKNKQDAVEFAKKHKGYTGNIVEQVAASLLDKSKQDKARDFVGPRDNFRSASYEKTTDHLDDSTEVNRYGHVFGFEPGGANIKSFKEGKLKSAEVNKEIVKGDVKVQELQAMVKGGIKPSEIPLTSGQGWRWGKMHNGIDLDGGDGSPISSAQDAEVVFAGDNRDDYGNTVVLRYSNGAETRFAHLKSVNVKAGQKIKAGQLLGRQGNTGSSTASHLHFEYFPSGGAMNYTGHGDAYSVKDSYFRYGGNVQPVLTDKPKDNNKLKPGQQPPTSTNPNIIDASKMPLSKQYQTIENLKPGQKIVYSRVGSIQKGKNLFGQPTTKYYDPSGKEISQDQFDNFLKNSDVLRQMKDNDRQLQNMQGGGYLDMNYKKINKPGMISNYSLDDEPESSIYIQPVYIERIVPLPGKHDVMGFPGNSTSLNSTSAGSRNLAR